jgi:hypothetical protein
MVVVVRREAGLLQHQKTSRPRRSFGAVRQRPELTITHLEVLLQHLPSGGQEKQVLARGCGGMGL